jgi:predicted MFS family arabinose efflux permease
LVIAAVVAADSAGQLSLNAQPQLMGPIMRSLGLGEEAVGWLYSIEITALAIASLTAAGPLARCSRTRVALLGGVLAGAGHATSGFIVDFEPLVASRVVAGIGSGLLVAAANAAAASAPNPDRLFAIAGVTNGLLYSIFPTLFPYVTVSYGASGGFIALGLVCFAVIPFFARLLPARETPEESPDLMSAPNRDLALVTMLALFIYELGQAGVWAFLGQIGERAGLNEYAVGNVLSGTGLAGISGGVLAAFLGVRYGRTWPIAIGIGLNSISAAALVLSHDPIPYVILNLIWNSSYYFVVPYIMGLLAALDDLGRWAVAALAVWFAGDALGPGIAGSIVERAGYVPLAGMVLVTGLVCVVSMPAASRRLGKRSNHSREVLTPTK